MEQGRELLCYLSLEQWPFVTDDITEQFPFLDAHVHADEDTGQELSQEDRGGDAHNLLVQSVTQSPSVYY